MGTPDHIASDYPGYFREALVGGGFADGVMFFQGAAGDIKQAGWHDQTPSFCASAKDARENGQRLASALVSALQNPVEPVSGPFFCTQATIPAMLKAPMPIHDMERQASEGNANPLIRQWAQRFLPSVRSGDVNRELPIELQWVSLGDRPRFITFQGEPATMLAQRIRALDQHPEGLFVLGYTNGLKAYLPTDAMIAEGGYEAELSHCVYPQPAGLDSGIERQITNTIKRFSSAVERTGEPNGYGRYHLAQPSGKAFFVLSAGRCGTMTLARILDTADNARVWHHPQPDPIRESLLAYQGRIDKRAVFWKMRQSVIQNTWAKGQIHGETDLLMTPFCDMLAEEIEDAKFLLLVRHPADFVRSGMRRNYYCGHPWDVGRLRPSEGTADVEAWEEKDQFEKICWLWRETYARALQMKAAIGDDKVIVVRFEDLVGSTDSFRRLFDFLDLQGFDRDRIDTILSKKLNAQLSGDYAEPHAWSDALTNRLWDECGPIAEQFGYGRLPESASVHDRVAISQTSPSTPPKVLILEAQGTSTGGHLDHIVAALNNKYDIKYIKTKDTSQLPKLVDWADIVWLEWANQMAVHATHHIPAIKEKKVICRLHGYEVFTPYPGQIDWNVVDHLIFVAKHKQQLFKQNFGSIPTDQRLIRNGIDLSQFSVAAHKQNTKKLVLLGHLNFRKGLPLLLQFYHRLLKTDPTYYLYIRGEFQDPRLEMAAKTMIKELSLEKKLEFVDWVEDLNTWFVDKSHILSFSLEESFHYAIGNGMAAGLKPVIHAWHESRDIWPSSFIFKDVDEFIDILARDDYDPLTFRHMLNEYGLSADVQIDQIDRLLSMAGSQMTAAGRGDNVAKEHANATIPLSILSEPPETGTTAYPVNSVATLATQLQKQWLALSPHNDDEIQSQIDQLQSRGHVQTVKCERLLDYDGIWEVEFGIEANGSGLCLQFNVFDKIDNKLYCPFDIDDGLNEKLKQLAIDCMAAPHFKLGDNNRGKIHNQSLLTHINENFQEYVWERMYPGTVFTPLGNFLKHMNRYRYVRQFLQPNSIVVDAACGIGYGAKYLSASCERIYGVDISSECLALSQKYYHAENASWLKEDVTKLSIEDHSVDVFVSMETFEHLNSPERMLLEMRRCLKSDGYGFVSTPNGGSPKRKRVDNPYHTKEFTFAEMMTYGHAFFDQVSIFGVEENFQVVEISDENNHRFDNLLVVLQAES